MKCFMKIAAKNAQYGNQFLGTDDDKVIYDVNLSEHDSCTHHLLELGQKTNME